MRFKGFISRVLVVSLIAVIVMVTCSGCIVRYGSAHKVKKELEDNYDTKFSIVSYPLIGIPFALDGSTYKLYLKDKDGAMFTALIIEDECISDDYIESAVSNSHALKVSSVIEEYTDKYTVRAEGYKATIKSSESKAIKDLTADDFENCTFMVAAIDVKNKEDKDKVLDAIDSEVRLENISGIVEVSFVDKNQLKQIKRALKNKPGVPSNVRDMVLDGDFYKKEYRNGISSGEWEHGVRYMT